MTKNYLLRLTDFVKRNYVIIIIIFFAFIVRVWGIYFDFPGVRYIHDETYHVSYIVKALAERTFYPDVILQYPLFLTFLYFPIVVLKIIYLALREGLFSASELKAYMITEGMGQLIIMTRWISALFGAATVYLVYRISNIIFRNKLGSYFAAIAYSFSLVPVFLSHWGRGHSVMMFFILLSLLWVLIFEKKKQIKYLYLSVLASALAISVHYLGINSLIFPFLGVVYNRKLINKKIILNSFLIYIGAFLIFYALNFIGIKWMVLNNLFEYYAKSGSASLSPVGFWERFYFVIRDSFWISPIFTLLALGWVIKITSVYKYLFTRYLLIGILFNYLIMISVVAAPNFSRWLLPFISLNLILASGLIFKWIQDKIKSQLLIYFIIAALLFPGVYLSVKYSLLLQNNTRIEAARWIESNIDQKDIIYSFDYTVEVPLSVNAARWQVEENNINSAKLKYMLNNEERFADYGYDLFYSFGKNNYQSLGGENTKYILISYHSAREKEEFLNNLKKYHQLSLLKSFQPTRSRYLENKGAGDVVNNPNNFVSIALSDGSGPFVGIYQIIYDKN